MTPSHKSHSKYFCCLSSLPFLLKCHWFDFHLHLFYLVFGYFLVFLVSKIIHSYIKELFQFFSFYLRVHVFSERRIPKSDPLRRSKHSLIRSFLDAWIKISAFLALDKPQSFRSVFCVLVGHTSKQHVSKILVGSFNWLLTLRISRLSMHELLSWPHISKCLYYFVRKFATIVALRR